MEYFNIIILNNSNHIVLRVFHCGSSRGVPAETVVLANCWGTNFIAQCHEDSTWHTYRGGANASPPSPALCQFQKINSPGRLCNWLCYFFYLLMSQYHIHFYYHLLAYPNLWLGYVHGKAILKQNDHINLRFNP